MIILYGAGINAHRILNSIMCNFVSFLVDRDPLKSGRYVYGKPIVDYDTFREKRGAIPVVITVNDVSQQLKDEIAGNVLTLEEFRKEFCVREEIVRAIDEQILIRRKYCNEMGICFVSKIDNWYREQYYSKINKKLVQLMKAGNREAVDNILNNIYRDEKVYDDEYYVNRPGMRLSLNVIKNENDRFEGNIIDIACGHGDFLKKIQDNFKCRMVGLDGNDKRVEYLNNYGIEAVLGSAESIPFDSNIFDYATCFECLEHLSDVVVAVKEIYRILKKGGKVFCTVPMGTNCDCDGHVRQFEESTLFSLFTISGFKVETVMRIPYLNYSIDDNIFIEAIKE